MLNYKLRLLLAGSLALIHSGLFAQESLTIDMLVPDKAIKVSPLHLLNFYPTVELSYEQKILPGITAQAEVGYVLNYRAEASEDFQDKRGVKVKLEARYYFWGRTDRRKMYYAAVEPYLNIINFDRQDSRQECFDLECNHPYTREYQYKMEYREQGITLKAGLIRYFGSDFFFDINSGLTLRNIHYREPSFPGRELNEAGWRLFDIPDERSRVTVSPHLGARIGYRLK